MQGGILQVVRKDGKYILIFKKVSKKKILSRSQPNFSYLMFIIYKILPFFLSSLVPYET